MTHPLIAFLKTPMAAPLHGASYFRAKLKADEDFAQGARP